MKRTKKVLFLAVLFASIFCLVGRVNAGTKAWGIKNQALICDPQVLEAGKKSDCYFLGTQETASTGYQTNNAGFYMMIYTTQNLELVDAKANTNLKDVGSKLIKNSGTNVTNISTLDANMPEGLKNFKCDIAKYTGKTKNKNDAGCAVFYTYKGKTAAFNKGSMAVYGYLSTHQQLITKLNIDAKEAVVLGTIEVKLPEKSNLEGCGDICIATFAVATEDDWAHGDCINNEMDSEWDTTTGACGSANPTTVTPAEGNKNMVDGKYFCYELTLKSVVPQNTGTGAFVSYAILAAGALIAISAVTISKKHNRLQKI